MKKNARAAGSSHRKGERGSVLAYTVLSVLFLFFAVGLGVDLSHLYLAKTELQNTADAAALAGASAMTIANPTKIATAVDRAVNVMNLNKYNFNNKDYAPVMSLASQRALVRFAINLSEFDNGGIGRDEATATAAPDDIRFVRVVTPTVPVNIFFSIPILGLARNMSAIAVAGLSIPGNVSVCIAPLSAIQCAPGDPNCDLGQFRGECPGANPIAPQPAPSPCAPGDQTCVPCDPNVQTCSGPDPDGDGFCDPTKEFCKGCTYTIRAEPAGGPSPGNYQILSCAGSGASLVRDALARYNDCQCGLKQIGDEIDIPTQPGVAAGPVRQGLNVRFDIYGGGGLSYGPDYPPDTNIAQGTSSGTGNNQTWSGINWTQYGNGSPFLGPDPSHTGVDNRRVLVIPIVPISEFSNGRSDVNVSGLGGFFMKSQVGGGNDGDIKVEYIHDDIVGVIGFDPNNINQLNIVTPVLYR
jgi:Flp pilus assembly protein TadG